MCQSKNTQLKLLNSHESWLTLNIEIINETMRFFFFTGIGVISLVLYIVYRVRVYIYIYIYIYMG
jgi:hypothetical protein